WGEINPNGTCGRRFDFEIKGKKYDHKYIYEEIGYNLKPIELQGAFALAQLAKLPQFIQKRKQNYLALFNALKDLKEYFAFPGSHVSEMTSWFAFPLLIKQNAGFSREEVLKWLEKDRIETRPLFAGNIIYHPAYTEIDYKKASNLSITDFIFEKAFFIGVFPGLNHYDLTNIIKSLRTFIQNKEKRFKQ
ncbi:MAG: DegT/DnrJ/EryC1/StrS family aminotransferase, partial [Candidatus Hodarchaeota archaeon]